MQKIEKIKNGTLLQLIWPFEGLRSCFQASNFFKKSLVKVETPPKGKTVSGSNFFVLPCYKLIH